MVSMFAAAQGVEAATALGVAQTTAFALVSLAALVLLYYLTVYVGEILSSPYRDRRWYLAVGVAAAVVYGLAGLAGTLTQARAAETFRFGATLFFFLFSAVGVRALYATVKLDRASVDSVPVPGWVWYAVIGAFVVAWWGAYLFAGAATVGLVETVGLAGAVTYTLGFAVLTVRDAEGTAIAAVIRQFVPALLCFAVIAVAEQLGRYTAVDPGALVGITLVSTVLVGAFLFTTAVAIRQQGGEVHRMYDRTTWQQETLE